MASRYAGPAMTLGNMRRLGVRSIEIACNCGRAAIVDVSSLPDALEVPALRGRLKCAECGARPIDVRPNWRQHTAHRP